MKDDFYISTDKRLLDKNFINGFLQNSYWGQERTNEQTEKTVENSLCFGMYTKANEQIGFVRVVTDHVFFGYVADVIIDNKYQGRGLGAFLMESMLDHDTIKGLLTVALKTKDAHYFYEKYGFKKVGNSELWMSIDRQKLN